GLARAIILDSHILFLDEPTSGLDPVATQEFIDVVNTIKSRGTAVLIVTHDLLCAHQLADQIGIMQGGQLTQLIHNQSLDLAQLTDRYFNQFSV
ncbi:hypothetical protein LCGC14_1516080, partial [marine sediment metagenome]